MKLTDIEAIFYNYESAKSSPSRMAVRFGCDCGCGGDSYTAESWDEEERFANESILEMKHLCEKLNIEYDGMD